MTENPGTESVENLLKGVHQGSYVIPYFQRGFEWQPSMVCDLIQSILQNYYTGLILLWELDPEEADKEEWEPVWGADTQGRPTTAILDGQQRLASLYYAIYNPPRKFPRRQSYYLFFVDLNKLLVEDYEEVVTYRYYGTYRDWQQIWREKDSYATHGTMPLAILSAPAEDDPHRRFVDSREFEEWITTYVSRNRDRLGDNITTHRVYQRLKDVLDYHFVIYPLSNRRDLPDICNIFARVNEKGMKLSTFDLMNAFMYPKGVRLRVDLWENLDNDQLKAVDSNMNEYLLKLISLVKQNYCSSKYLYNLIPGQTTVQRDAGGSTHHVVLVRDSKEFNALWQESCKYAEKARQTIMNTGDANFGAIKADYVPNTTLIPVLGALFWLNDGRPDEAAFRSVLTRWYWSAVLSEDYSGSSDTVMARDFRDWRAWIENRQGDATFARMQQINEDFVRKLDLQRVRRGSARYNAIICMLALQGAKDFYEAQTVGTVDYANERIHDHHIFPKRARGLPANTSGTFGELKDCILNRTLLLDETNSRIRTKKPSEYLREMVRKHGSEERVKEILRDHFITGNAYECMKHDDFDGFVAEREEVIRRHILSLLRLPPNR